WLHFNQRTLLHGKTKFRGDYKYSSCALHVQPAGKVVEPACDGILIKRRNAQGVQVAPQFMDILRGDNDSR
ncbi:hypothetical protein ACIPUN_20755, partial [Pectobacterium sp. CHL-2024]|uniref:hypothetical protein n=1 Tax=Pectobacterium sp. CHL-2024 TaxID=3377079 RepID=UPI00381E27AE